MDPDRAIAKLAESQFGTFTRVQALRAGLSSAACSRRLASGAWEPLFHGAYVLEGAPRTPQQPIKAACLVVPGAVASHRAAGTVLALRDIEPLVEITVPESRRVHIPGIRAHRAVRLDAVDRDRADGIPITSVARTVIDLAGVLDCDELEALVDHVLATRRVPLGYLRRRLDDLGTAGRNGAGTLAGLLAARRGVTRHVDSQPQRELRRLFVSAGLPPAEYEHPVRLPDGSMRYLDAAFVDQLLAIEVDSYLCHSTLPAWSRDQTRDGELVALGWRVLHVTPLELTESPSGLVDRVARALAAIEVRRLLLA